MGRIVGYQHVLDSLALTAFPPEQPAQVRPVTRITRTSDWLGIPENVAPAARASLLEHVLFALKHEGIHLALLAQALPRLDPQELIQAVQAQPRGSYLRKLCTLWEAFQQEELPVRHLSSQTIPLFDPRYYVTRQQQVQRSRWGVLMNGLGQIGGAHGYCPVVRRTSAVLDGESSDLFHRLQQFQERVDPDLLQRTWNWAYLSETTSTYQIERETPAPGKAETFMRLLQRAHDPGQLDEAMMVSLQQAIVSNPWDQAVQYRTEQNWLSDGGIGLLGVTYVPPPPDILPELMQGWAAMVNSMAEHQDVAPVLAASLASFGFVFAHPFMDGNGRLSRYLFHRQLAQSGVMADGAMLPISTAIARHEKNYLQALKSFSAPARQRWSGLWIAEGDMELRFEGDAALYRYWDATECVTFGFAMAEQALSHDLVQESRFLRQFDTLKQAVNQRYDVNDRVLNQLVRACLSQGGRMSNNLRKKFADQLQQQEGIFDFLEARAAEL